MDGAMQAKQQKKTYIVDTNRNGKEVTANYCDGILNFEPGMTLGQNWQVFIVFSTVTPNIRKSWGCPKNCLQKYVSNVTYF